LASPSVLLKKSSSAAVSIDNYLRAYACFCSYLNFLYGALHMYFTRVYLPDIMNVSYVHEQTVKEIHDPCGTLPMHCVPEIIFVKFKPQITSPEASRI
jgi:hypothetical protein